MNSTSKRLYRYIVRQKNKILLGVLATLLMGLVELFTGSLLKTLINLVDEFSGSFSEGFSRDLELHVKYSISLPLVNDDLSFLNETLSGSHEIFRGMIWLCVLFVGIYFLLAMFNYGRRVYMNAATQRILQNFKYDIYEKVLRMPFLFFGRNKTGDVVSRITYDVTTLSEIIDLFIEVARALVYMLVFIPVMFFLSWQLTLFTILFFPASFILIDFITRHIKKVSKKITDNVGDYTAFLEEKINRFKLIKGFRTEKQEAATFSDLVESNYQYNLRLIKLKYFLNPSNEFLGMVALSVVYLFYAYRLSSGHTSLGDIVFYLYLVRTAYKPVKKVAQAWGQLHIALVSTRKIFRLLDETEEELDRPVRVDDFEKVDSLILRDIRFTYPGNGRMILEGISFEAKRGDIVAVSGKSGAGKSTLMNLIPAFLSPTGGEILINGTRQSEFSMRQLRSRIAHVDGNTLFMNGTIRENIEYGNCKLEQGQAEDFAGFLGLNGGAGLDLLIGKDGEDLSEGQKQKMAFLRDIVMKPAVLIMDEAFSSLDQEDIEYVMRYSADTDIRFIVSRKKEVVKFANKTLALNNQK